MYYRINSILNSWDFTREPLLSEVKLTSETYLSNKTSYSNSNSSVKKTVKTDAEREAEIKSATEYYNKNAKPGSLAAKANLVKEYNEKNNK